MYFLIWQGEEPHSEVVDIDEKIESIKNNADVNELVATCEGQSDTINEGQEQLGNEIESNEIASQCYKDSIFNFLIGVIVAAIAFLIYRRIFLL